MANPTPEKPAWWCNFCGFATDDQPAYLAHSCQDVLRQAGKPAPGSGDQRHCS